MGWLTLEARVSLIVAVFSIAVNARLSGRCVDGSFGQLQTKREGRGQVRADRHSQNSFRQGSMLLFGKTLLA